MVGTTLGHYQILEPLGAGAWGRSNRAREPCRPWYLLDFRTPQPLTTWNYFTHWVHVCVRRDYLLMQPMEVVPFGDETDGWNDG